MAVTVDRAPRPLPASSTLERWTWSFLRISGVLLLLFAYVHFAIMHLVNNVDVVDYDFVAGRWASLGWRLFDWLLLVLALTHGVAGLRVILDDYVHAALSRRMAFSALWALYAVLMLVGTLTVVLFQPVSAGH